MADRMTQQELESYLWGAAIILRGLVDAGDYKQYVFPLLFYKRLSESRSLPTTAATPPRSFTPTARWCI